MSWFKKILPSRVKTNSSNRRTVPEGLWTKCIACNAVLYRAELERNFEVCPKCDHHIRIDARERLLGFFDEGTAEELSADMKPVDILKFRDNKRYKDRLNTAYKGTGENDALLVMTGRLLQMPVVAAAFEFDLDRKSVV